MKGRVFAAAAVLACGLCLVDPSRAAEPLDKDAFAPFLAKVQAAAQTAKLTDPNDPMLIAQGLSYGEGALAPLAAALAAAPASETGVYTAGRLLLPLLSSDVEVVRKAISIALSAYGRLGRYQAPPVFSKADLLAMSPSAAADAKGDAEASLRIIMDFSDRRQRRVEAEAKVVRNNTQVMILEKVLWQVLLRANRPSEDDRLLDAMTKAEQEKRASYQMPLHALAAQASGMDQARAARLYGLLERTGRPIEMVEANYLTPWEIKFGTRENSALLQSHLYPGLDVLAAANALAPVAKQPVIPAMSPAEVSATNLLNRVKDLLSHGKLVGSDEVKGILDQLTKYYGQTKAGAEARRIQSAASPPPPGKR
jgi:hypothetical protein